MAARYATDAPQDSTTSHLHPPRHRPAARYRLERVYRVRELLGDASVYIYPTSKGHLVIFVP